MTPPDCPHLDTGPERLYYVMDTRTYVGNCALFWAKNAAANRYHSYLRGWRHGCCSMAKAPDFAGHPTLSEHYLAGYADGIEAHSAAVKHAIWAFGYEPSILRKATP